MQKRKLRILSTISLLATIVFFGNLAFAGQVLEFKDGTIIKGDIQNETLTVQTSFGKLQPKVGDIVFISEGSIELRDGSKIVGSLVVDDQGLVVKTKYGTWTLRFKPEDIKMITSQK